MQDVWQYCSERSKSVEVLYDNLDGDKMLSKVHFRYDPSVSTLGYVEANEWCWETCLQCSTSITPSHYGIIINLVFELYWPFSMALDFFWNHVYLCLCNTALIKWTTQRLTSLHKIWMGIDYDCSFPVAQLDFRYPCLSLCMLLYQVTWSSTYIYEWITLILQDIWSHRPSSTYIAKVTAMWGMWTLTLCGQWCIVIRCGCMDV